MVRILAVDNELSVVTSLRFVFGPPSYQLTAITRSEEVLPQLDQTAEPFDVVIVDQKMPNLSGDQLIAAMRERGLTTKVVVLSAQVTDEVRRVYEELKVEAIVQKPFDLAELRAVVSALA